MGTLPLDATAASHARFVLAQTLAQAWPPASGAEIAVTGSVALGIADDSSDLEMNLWVDDLPSVEERVAFVKSVGGAEAMIEPEPWGAGTFAMAFRYCDIWVEAAWMTRGAVEERLRPIITGDTTGRLALAWVIEHAVPLRTYGQLGSWQQSLAIYPDRLHRRVIEARTQTFQMPHRMADRWTFCRRRQPLALTERLTADIYNVLRLLFALNRRWEPDFKWLRHVTGDLAVTPERLAERVEKVFTVPELERRVATSLELIRDTLALLPATPGVERARVTVEEVLRQGSGSR